jgi:fructokinase
MPAVQQIVGLGEVLWDVFPSGAVFGGAPANFACHVAGLGARAAMVSAVGDDRLGRGAIAALEARGVDASHVRIATQKATGTVDVVIDSAGAPTYLFAADTAWDHLAWEPTLDSLARSCAAVCFGTLAQRSKESRRVIRRFVEATPASSLRVFDVNLRQNFFDPETIRESLDLATVLKLNAEELPTVAAACGKQGTSLLGTLQGIRQRHGLQAAVLTLGAEGSIVVTENEVSEQPAVAVKVADTVGAGDAFTAAVVVGLLRRLPLAVIHRHAASVAAFVCTQRGATPEIPLALQIPADAELQSLLP